jgi:Na+-driven multidrug efflux pump
MLVNIVMNVVNVIAGRAFIFGLEAGGSVILPPMGAAGAALAITSARAVGAAIFLFILTRGTSAVRLRSIRELRPDKATLGLIFIVGIPASVESLMFTGGKLITQTFLAGLGEVAMTADYLASVTAGLIQVPVSSLSMAAAPLVSGRLGTRDGQGARRVILASLLLGEVLLLAMAILSFPFIRAIVGLSSPRADVVNLAAGLLRFFLFVIPLFWGSSFIIPSGLRGAGDGRYTMWVAIFSMWIFRVGLGWLLSHPLGLGVLGIWIAMAVDWGIRSAFFVPRLLSEAWIPSKPRKP